MSEGNGRPAPPASPRRIQTPRRIVVLEGDEKSEVCLVGGEYQGDEPEAIDLHEMVHQFATTHAGKWVALEGLAAPDQCRFVVVGRRTHPS